MLRRIAIVTLILLMCVGGGLAAYYRYLRPVRVAVLRFDDVVWTEWEAAGRRAGYTVHRYDHDELASAPLANYNFIVIRAMGLELDEDQIANLQRARQRGSQILFTTISDPEVEKYCTLDEERKRVAASYLSHGGVENFVGLMHYLAHEFAGRDIRVPPVVERPLSGLFHVGGQVFETLDAYEAFLDQQSPHGSKDASRVAMVGPLLKPFNELDRKPAEDVIRALERQGIRVYPIFGSEQTVPLLEKIRPDVVIAFPVGTIARSGSLVDLLTRLKCPCVSALSIPSSLEEWLADPRGLSGPFMDLTITMPELEGVIEPIAITARTPNERNIRVRTPIADRVQKRLALVQNWLELRRKANSEKRLAIVYYKGPGESTLTAAGLEVAPSLFNLLKRLEAEGYDLGGQLPDSVQAFSDMIQRRGRTIGQWAIGSYEKFLEEAQPEFVPASDYARWFRLALSPQRQKDMIELWGPIPGKSMVAERDGAAHLVVSRIRLGNVVIMPQPTVGADGVDEVQAIHGTEKAPPHFYLAAYLWARYGFQADAILHFGTHGSLEFTYGKSTCLSRDCWPDILIGDIPHIYPYVINNVGEALVAKRRSNAVIVSHLTPPFSESGTYGELSQLADRIDAWEVAVDPLLKEETRKTITRLVQSLDLGTDLEIPQDALQSRLLTDQEIERLRDYLHALSNERITDGLHVIGRSYTDDQVVTTSALMLSDQDRNTLLTAVGMEPSRESEETCRTVLRELVSGVVHGRLTPEVIFPQAELRQLREAQKNSVGSMPPKAERMQAQSGAMLKDALPADMPKQKTPAGMSDPQISAGAPMRDSKTMRSHLGSQEPQDQTAKPTPDPAAATASLTRQPNVSQPDRGSSAATDTDALRWNVYGDQDQKLAFLKVLDKIAQYAQGLRESPQLEMDRIVAALRGEYVPPSSGGDPLINPDSVPTGRNLYSINAEQTPTQEAWEVGRRLADELLEQHKAKTGNYPRRVAFTLWGGEFIRGRGTAIAQILHLIGVRPVWSSRGLVKQVEIVPSEELGRPRIDVLVQTSGQFRDAAASRITLIDEAIRRVSELGEERFANYVREDSTDAEMRLKNLGYSPKEAREFATARIFGAAENRSYGTGIMGMVEKGDTWQHEKEIAERYIENMGGIYRDGNHWGTYRKGLLEVQLQGTEVVVQSRSSNVWGPLSLDHVYEFMGGITLSIRAKTGKDPVGYFSDLRVRGQGKLTTSVHAIREELRTTIWNPKFLSGRQREGASAAGSLTETVRNLYGWTVMQPATITQQMWDETYRVFIEDKHQLKMREFFEKKNVFALQDLTSIMLETARKGYWKPRAEVLQRLAALHAELVASFGAACSYETCGNRKLQEFVTAQLNAPGNEVAPEVLDSYTTSLAAALQSSRPMPEVEGIELEETWKQLLRNESIQNPLLTVLLAAAIVLFVVLLLLMGLIYRDAAQAGTL